MLLHEKADQVQPLLHETNLDCWLIFARETEIHPDPGVELVVGADVVRNSAFLFSAGGERTAIVARFEDYAAFDKRHLVTGGIVGDLVHDRKHQPDAAAVALLPLGQFRQGLQA